MINMNESKFYRGLFKSGAPNTAYAGSITDIIPSVLLSLSKVDDIIIANIEIINKALINLLGSIKTLDYKISKMESQIEVLKHKVDPTAVDNLLVLITGQRKNIDELFARVNNLDESVTSLMSNDIDKLVRSQEARIVKLPCEHKELTERQVCVDCGKQFDTIEQLHPSQEK